MTDEAVETTSDRVVGEIRAHRKRRGWTMADLAARSGLSENIIANIESGRRDEHGRRRRQVTVDELEAIADAIGISPFALLFRGDMLFEPSGRWIIERIVAMGNFFEKELAKSGLPPLPDDFHYKG